MKMGGTDAENPDETENLAQNSSKTNTTCQNKQVSKLCFGKDFQTSHNAVFARKGTGILFGEDSVRVILRLNSWVDPDRTFRQREQR